MFPSDWLVGWLPAGILESSLLQGMPEQAPEQAIGRDNPLPLSFLSELFSSVIPHSSPRERHFFFKDLLWHSLIIIVQQPLGIPAVRQESELGKSTEIYFLSTPEMAVRTGRLHSHMRSFCVDMTPWRDGLSHDGLLRIESKYPASQCV